MRLFITLSKKSLCVILAGLIITVILLGQFFTIDAGGIDGSTNAARVGYIEGLGIAVDDAAATSKEIVIPENFSEVYYEYNRLQKTAGFDLLPYRGKSATVYTYPSADGGEMAVNIIVSDKLIIGGDISSVRIDGEMKALTPKQHSLPKGKE